MITEMQERNRTRVSEVEINGLQISTTTKFQAIPLSITNMKFHAEISESHLTTEANPDTSFTSFSFGDEILKYDQSRTNLDHSDSLNTSSSSTSRETTEQRQDLDNRENNCGSTSDIHTAAVSPLRHTIHKCCISNIYLYIGIVVVILSIIATWVFMELMSRKLKDDIKESLILRETVPTTWTQPKFRAFLTIYMFKFSENDDEIPSVQENGPYVYRYGLGHVGVRGNVERVCLPHRSIVGEFKMDIWDVLLFLLDIQRVNVTWHHNSSVSYKEHYQLFYDRGRSIVDEPARLDNLGFIRNNSVDTAFNVYTGESNFNQIYDVFSWNFATKLPFWNAEDQVSDIQGTDGLMFQPFLNVDSVLTLFYPQLERIFDLGYSESTTFKDIPVHRFTIKDSEFSNTSKPSGIKIKTNFQVDDLAAEHPHDISTKYCKSNCLRSGIYRMPLRSYGIPCYISLPHFLGADPYYLQLVNGLQPDESRHRSIFEVDQVTGITVNQKRRFQVNLHQLFGNGSEVYLPAYWFELSFETEDDSLTNIKSIHNKFQLLNNICLCVGLLLCLMLAVLISCLIYQHIIKHDMALDDAVFDDIESLS